MASQKAHSHIFGFEVFEVCRGEGYICCQVGGVEGQSGGSGFRTKMMDQMMKLMKKCKREITDLVRHVHPLPSVKVQDGSAFLREGEFSAVRVQKNNHDQADFQVTSQPLSASTLPAHLHSHSPIPALRSLAQSQKW